MSNRRTVFVLTIIALVLVGIASTYAQVGPRMTVSFLVNNELTDRDANRYILAGQTGDVVFRLEPSSTVVGPWSCNLDMDGTIIDSIDPAPQNQTGNNYTFAPTTSVRIMFHAVANTLILDDDIGCSTQTQTGQLLSNYVFFRVAQAQNVEPFAVYDAQIGGTSAYPAP